MKNKSEVTKKTIIYSRMRKASFEYKSLITSLLLCAFILACSDNNQANEMVSQPKHVEEIPAKVKQPVQQDINVEYYGLQQDLQRYSPLT